jgi:hypothetical protein
MRKLLSAIAILLVLSACSGGGSDDGGGSGPGPTTHAGRWTVVAIITAIFGGTVHNIETTSNINILSSGTVGIIETDTECALSMYINGNSLNYKEVCILEGTAAEDSDNVPCTVEFETRASIVSPTLGSGTFGPEQFVCLGRAISYSGTLVATRDSPSPTTATTTTIPATTTSTTTTAPTTTTSTTTTIPAGP